MNETLNAVKKELFDVYVYRYVIFSYVIGFLKLRYRRSYLGLIWTALAPSIHFIIIGLMFNLILRDSRPDFFAYYFSGAIYFSFFSGTCNRAVSAILANEHFIKKIYVPKLVYVLQCTGVELINFLLTSLILIPIGLLLGKLQLHLFTPAAFISVFLLFIFLVGLSTFLSILTVYFRDFLHILPAALQALFFISPILYDKSIIPEKHQWIFAWNPLNYYLDLFRTPLLTGTFCHFQTYLLCISLSLITFIFGLLFLVRFDNKIVFRL